MEQENENNTQQEEKNTQNSQQKHTKMTATIESADKDLNTAIINMLQDLKDNMNIMKKEMMSNRTKRKLQR